MTGDMHPVMTEAQWDALRTAMLALPDRPAFRVRFLDGDETSPDLEWMYHFRQRGYHDIRHVDLLTNMHNHADVLHELLLLHAPGETIKAGFRVFGHVAAGQRVPYLHG